MAFIAPLSLKCRTSARVSSSAIPTFSSLIMKSSNEPLADVLEATSENFLMITPATCILSDSDSSGCTP